MKDLFGKWKNRKPKGQEQILKTAEQGTQLTGSLTQDENTVFAGLGGSADIIKRRIMLGNVPAVLIYIEGIVEENVIHRDILAKIPLVKGVETRAEILADLAHRLLATSTVKKTGELADILVEVLLGNTVLIMDGQKEGLILATHGGERRSSSEPSTERSLRGSREGFVENITTNLAFIRRKIKSAKLVIETTTLGQRSLTKVALIYISDIADPKIVQEVRHRISKIDVDAMLASGYIEHFFEDHPYSVFPQVLNTERPDRVVTNLLEGRVAVVVDGTPVVLILPAVFIQFLQGTEDYYERTVVGTVTRFIRYLAFMITTTSTAFYIALITFHHSLLPTDLLLAVAEHRQKVPFSPLAEALFMEVTIEMLREAGLRLPAPVGQTLGLVGGIVIGQAVVQANLVSPLIVVVVALSAVSSFVFPSYSMALAIRLIKFPMMILAASFGALGAAVGWLFFTIHLASMESFGVPYLAPLAPMRYADLADTFGVPFIWKRKKRPVSIPHLDDQRLGDNPQEQVTGEK